MKLAVMFLLSVSALIFTPTALAAKPRVRTSVAKGSVRAATGYSQARLSRGTNSIVLTFINLSKVSKSTYTLSYTANGIEQGAIGSLVPTGNESEKRDIYFGTCSHGVCTPHRGIQRAVLLVETQLKSGGTNVKRYKVRI